MKGGAVTRSPNPETLRPDLEQNRSFVVNKAGLKTEREKDLS